MSDRGNYLTMTPCRGYGVGGGEKGGMCLRWPILPHWLHFFASWHSEARWPGFPHLLQTTPPDATYISSHFVTVLSHCSSVWFSGRKLGLNSTALTSRPWEIEERAVRSRTGFAPPCLKSRPSNLFFAIVGIFANFQNRSRCELLSVESVSD